MSNQAEQMAVIYVPTSKLKVLREHLCYSQSVRNDPSSVVGCIIEQIDVYRPLGPDGKHDNRHTLKCGCEDK